MKEGRLYYLFPDVSYTKEVVRTLILNGIELKNISVLAKEGTFLDDLPEAGVLQKTDFKHSIFLGMVCGAILGIGIGLALHSSLSMPIGGWMVVTTVIGVFLGAWGASMIGLSTENVELKPFAKAIEKGNILMMVDVSSQHLEKISDLLDKEHRVKQYQYVGNNPNFLSFP